MLVAMLSTLEDLTLGEDHKDFLVISWLQLDNVFNSDNNSKYA